MENTKKDLENMKQVYGVKGTLPKDFVGQISYTVCLDKPYEELDIEFSFDKQHYSSADLTPALLEELRTLCRREYDMELSDAELERLAYQEMKTEIHTLASSTILSSAASTGSCLCAICTLPRQRQPKGVFPSL